MDISLSVNGVPIRLTAERWLHIVENHDDMAGYFDDVLEVIDNPELILPGHHGALIAIRGYGPRRYLNVMYREKSGHDGFVITAFFTDRISRDKAIWKQR